MIFRTIIDDITGANKSIGLFGLSLQNVKNKLQEIQTVGFKNAIFNSSTIDKSAIDKYNQSILNGVSAQQALATASRNTNRATIALMESANGATISTEQLTAAQQASTLSSKALSMAIKTVSVAMNMIAFALIAKGIQLAADAIDHYVNRAKYAAEAMEEAQQAIDDAQSSLKNVFTTLSENKDRFLELSQGVDKFSKNLSLSEEDYAEYLSISNQLAELSPSLVSGYDEQGNALLAIGKNADETNEKLQSVLENQQAIAQQTLIDNMDDVATGIYYEVEDAKSSIESMETELASLQDQFKEVNVDIASSNGLISFSDDDYSKYGKAMENALTSAGIEFEKNASAGLYTTAIQLVSASPQQLEQAQKFYDAWLNSENEYYHASENGLKQDIEEKEKSIETSYAKMTANLQAWVKDNYNYQYLSDDASAMVDALIPEIKWDELEEAPITASDYQNYVEENIIKPLMEVPQEHKQEIDNMLQQLLSFEDGDLDVLEFAEQLQARLKELGITIDITPIIADEQEAKDKLQNSIEAIAEGGSSDFTTSSGVKVDADDYKTLQEYTKDFTSDQIELWNKSTLGAENATDAINKYEEALKSASNPDEITVSTGISDTIDRLNTQLKPTFDALKDAYQNIFKSEDGEIKFSLDDVDISTFESIKSAIDDLNEIEGVDVNYGDFEDFVKVLSDTSSTSEEVQDQFDKLATSIVYSSDCTEMSKDNFDLLCKSLYEMGLTNAPEVLRNIRTAQEELKASGINLTTVTGEEAQAFINEAESSDIAIQYLRMYMLKKELANDNQLDTTESIQSLKKLCEQLGMTCNALGKTSELMQAVLSLESATNAIAAGVDYSGQYARQAEDAKKKIEDIKNGNFEDYNYNFNSNVTSPSSSKGSSGSKDSNKPSEVTKPFNWIENYLKAFARRTEKTMNQISDYLSFKKNLSTIKSAIKSVRSELYANEQALAEYAKQMNAIGLDAKYIEKIKNGALEIETITGYETDGNKDANAQLIEKIEKYQDLYDKYTDIEDTIEDLRETEKEWLVKNLEYVNEYYQKLSDIKNLAIDKKQDNIDLKEAQGKKVTTSDYKKLVSNNEAYIKSLRTTYKKTNAEFNKLVKNGTIEKNSAEWFEWKETLADLNSEIVQAQINTAEWKDEINQIKIDNYTSSLDRLEAKYDKLNTTISRKESSNIIVTQSDYNKVIKNLDQQISKNEELLALYKSLQSQTQKNSAKWREYQELIEQTESTIDSLGDSIIETAEKMAGIIAEIKNLKLEDNENASNLLDTKYENATSASERNKILDEKDTLAKSNYDINQQATKDYTAQADKLGKQLSQYISKATKGVTDSKANAEKISSYLQKERESYNSYANAYARAQEKYSKVKTKKEKSSIKAEMENLSLLMDESSKKIESLSTALSSYNTDLEANQSILSQLDGYEFGKEIDLSKITDKGLLETASQYNETLKQQKQAFIDAGLSEQEYIKALRESASQRIQNIIDEAEALDVLNQAMKSQIKSKMDLNKTQGYNISDVEYENYIGEVSDGIKLYRDKYNQALAEFNNNLKAGVYKDNDEKYLEDKAKIEALKTSIYESYAENESMLDEILQSRIDALNEEKEAIQKLYDLQERRYKLEEAQYNLEKAKQRTNLVYNGTEFVYQADTNALKDAEKALEEAQYGELINKIDDWIEAIEVAKEDINLYDANGNTLGSTEDIIKAARKFGDNFLDGFEKLLAKNGYAYSNGEITKVQAFAEGGVVGKSDDDKFKAIAKSLGEENLVAVKNDEMVLTKLQGNELYKKLVGTGTVPTPILDLKPVIPDNLVRVNTAPNVSIDMSGMQFNEVQNMDEFTREIQKMANKASSMMIQELGKRKM